MYAAEQGASSVVGIDLSERMLSVAREKSKFPQVQYQRCAIEDIVFSPESFDIVLSSLALHYVESFEKVAQKVASYLVCGGDFVFSVEHPVFTAYGSQDWIYADNGEILHFPVDNYYYEGPRQAIFLGEKVVKYHKTLTTYLDGLLQNGFSIKRVIEPQPPEEMWDQPGMKDEMRRPMMLIIAARKKIKGERQLICRSPFYHFGCGVSNPVFSLQKRTVCACRPDRPSVRSLPS